MRVWPVIIDSQPTYLNGHGRSASLLLAPLGTSVVLRRLTSALAAVTGKAPLVVAGEDAGVRYADWVRAVCPTAQVVGTPQEFSEALAAHELSDALLFVDPRCLPIRGLRFAELMRHYVAQPQVAHHLVAFERAVAGTKERVCFDARGQIRGIQRYYEQTTWPFLAGVTASLVPNASFIIADGLVPRSLAELRQLLISHGVPSRDVPIEGALDLGEEQGMLAANEQAILASTSNRPQGNTTSATVHVGEGHAIHASARLMGPVIVHPHARIEAGATVMGPSVIGEGARIGSGALVAHVTIGPDCTIPPDSVVRDRAWFRSTREHAFGGVERPPMAYSERLARLSIELEEKTSVEVRPPATNTTHLVLKRGLDAVVAAIGLMMLLPLVVLVAVAIWLESRGPTFYGDNRENLGGRVFKCWKFRTMYTGAHLAQLDLNALNHTDGPHFKIDRDPRVTRMGRILRALNLDELPQLFNVLTGDMSLVGPRPSPFRENQVCVPWRDARLSVRPGITGLWQVCRHDRSAGDFHQWIEYDLLYVQRQSLWLDVKILVATILTLGGKVGHVNPSWLVETRSATTDTPVTRPVQRPDEAEQVA